MVASGIEGGSLDGCRSWMLQDYLDLREHWRVCGIPVHMSVAQFMGIQGKPKENGGMARPESPDHLVALMNGAA